MTSERAVLEPIDSYLWTGRRPKPPREWVIFKIEITDLVADHIEAMVWLKQARPADA